MMTHRSLRGRLCAALLFAALCCPTASRAQFNVLETDHLRLVYYGQAHAYLIQHVARSFENALAYHQALYGYTPGEKVTVMVHDMSDFGNAGAGSTPEAHIVLAIAPLSYAFETSPANERVNTSMNHELVHLVASDQAAAADRFFRAVFRGKVEETPDNPLSVLYSFLTAPRRAAPRWYHEGIAVFLETWMSGGLGRALGGYDEMVFRTLVREGRPLYSPVALESEGTSVDFQSGIMSYLYGTRFMSYLALLYGPERLIQWTGRTVGSRGYFARQFEQVYGLPMAQAWAQWTAWEQQWQRENLAAIRRNPVTPFHALAAQPLGSVSRAHYDAARRQLYVAVNYPGQVAHLAAVDPATGRTRMLQEVKGATLYDVCALAFDPEAGVLFYTADNEAWRDLRVYDLATGTDRLLIQDARVGDLAFNRADRSLWGVRHLNGLSSIVRMPPPYTSFHLVHAWPYGTDVYDLDVSPDGRDLVGALAEISGRQSLVRMSVDSLAAGRAAVETLFDFETSNPANFTFSDDGRYLYGSSYYSGASNVFRYDLAARRMEVMSNAETGFFRPSPLSEDSLFVFRFTADGFLPGLIPNRPVERVGAVRFLGQAVVEQHPIVKDWRAAAPSAVPLDSLTRAAGPYHALRDVRLASVYPVVEGYKDTRAYGLRLNLANPVGLHRLDLTAAYSPGPALPADERFHASLNYGYRGWSVHGSYNGTDFFDLFGPTKSTRKGYAASLSYTGTLLQDAPKHLSYLVQVAAFGGFEQLPDYQNIDATYDRLQVVAGVLSYTHYRSSLGAVDREKGRGWRLAGSSSLVNGQAYPRVYTTFDQGFLLPVPHLALWLHGAAGYAVGERENPFANFFFGGFGNNWVDRGAVHQYRSYYSFPGIALNAAGGTRFGKVMMEGLLPPLRFGRAGAPGFYPKWAQLTLFTAGLVTNPDDAAWRRTLGTVGGQLNLRLILFSHLSTTLSAGYARAFEQGQPSTDEWMFSIKLL